MSVFLECGDRSGRQRFFFFRNLFFRGRGHARQNIRQRLRLPDRETLEVIYLVLLQPLQHDIVCRYGGEEFLTILRGAGEKHCAEIAERIRTNIQELPIRTREVTMPMTVSIGAAVQTPDNDITAAQLIKRADQALYKSKHRGRDRVTVWQS